ncbi:MAG: nucleotidyltransferase domain-containing protein [Ignavibacteriales bacterium]|nr:nucleotidyltransferase domain-containing protein [Ignavibacteriales bacterium]
MQLLSTHKDKIRSLCEKYGVVTLYSFGSVNTSRFSEKSDIDFIVELNADDPIEYTDKYFHLKFELESLLKRTIDLLETTAIKNPYLKKSIDSSKVLIYGRPN